MRPSQAHAALSFILSFFALVAVARATPVQHHATHDLVRHPFNSTAPHRLTTTENVNKTILLNNGAAESRITFILHLRPYETISAIIHIPTRPSIITAASETIQQFSHPSHTLVNFTLFHEFDGLVGVATYNLLVYTNISQYRASGTYTVAGIVVYASENPTPLSIASGINSPGLSLNPSSFNSNTDARNLRLQVEYQPVGPDVAVSPPSLKAVLSDAQVRVEDVMFGTNSALVSYNDSCSLVHPPMESMHPSNQIMRCGICFNDTDQSLRITVNPERSGASIIKMSFPQIEVDDEIFETDVRLFVKKPDIVFPVVLIQPGTTILLDYYGTEVIYLQMYNIIQPDQPFNATDFIIDLDMNRYASADMALSRFDQPIQTIAFVVQPPGKEDPVILNKIEVALMGLKDSEVDSLEHTPDVLSSMEPMPTGSMRPDNDLFSTKFSLDPFTVANGSASNLEREYPSARMSEIGMTDPYAIEHLRISPIQTVYIRTSEKRDFYESNVHVIIPPSSSLRTAKNVLGNPLLTTFAPNQTAIISSGNSTDSVQHVLVSIFLANYSIPTFSEHKSRQLSQSLSKAIGNHPENQTNGSLTNLKSNTTGIIVTYTIPVPKDADKIASDVRNNGAEIGNKVAQDIWIPPGRLAVLNAAVYDASSPAVVDAVSNPESVLGGLSGPLLAAIIVLVIVALIPLSALCFGYLTVGNEQRDSHPTGDAYDSPPRMGPVIRDTQGRANEEEDQESFKMDEEMRRQGYYDDSATASNQEPLY